MKKQILILIVAMAILMCLEYLTRGYFAIGAEIVITPLCLFAMVEYRKLKRGEQQ